MSGKRYSDEFKVEVAKQVLEQGRPVRDVAARLGVSIDSLYAWIRKKRKAPVAGQADASLAAENRRLQAKVRRLAEERDILKNRPLHTLPRGKGEVRVHSGASRPVSRDQHVLGTRRAAQRVLRLAASTA